MPPDDRGKAVLTLMPALMLQTLFFLIPVSMIFIVSFTAKDSFFFEPKYVLDNFIRMFRVYRIDFQNTLLLAGIAGLIDVVLAYPFAYILLRKVRRFADVFRAILIIPLFGELYIAYGLFYLTLPGGPLSYIFEALGIPPLAALYSFPMTILGLTIYTFPFVVYNIGISLQGIDKSLEEAALCLGESRLGTFFRIILPLSMPGLLSGWLISFGWNLGAFAIPVLLGGPILSSRVLSVQIWTTSLVTSDFGMGAALGVVVVLATTAIFFAVLKLTRGVLV